MRLAAKWLAWPETGGTVRGPTAGRIGAELLNRLATRIALADGGRKAIEVSAPFTGQVFGRIPRGTAADVDAAVRAARVAQPNWAAMAFRERARIFLDFHDRVLDRKDEVLDLIQLESGKARRHAYEEVVDVAITARYYAHHGGRFLRPRRRRGTVPGLTATREILHPRGVVGIIAPWNYPLSLSATDAIPALLAGNAVILKPDVQTTFTALWVAALLYESGLPRDLFQVVTGEGAEVGPPLIESVDYIAFTGSTETGRTVARDAADRLIGCSLELGGKNPMIVLADADLDRAAAAAAHGSFANAGQLCISIERIYVEAPVYERFLERFVGRTRDLRLGATFDYSVDVGSLTSRRQLEKVMAHVTDAVEKGAVVRTGGQPRPEIGPYFFEPTILTGVTPEMKAFGDETFGPVVAVYPVDSAEEAVARANATRYGLNASIWTEDVALGTRLARRIQAGTVNVNDIYAATWGSVDAPMGGFKESGLGRRHGREGILKYTESQTISVQRGVSLSPPPGLDRGRLADWLGPALKLWRRIPWLR